MDIEKYEELTGLTVAPSQEALVKANIRRTKAMLETLLGFTLSPKNLYNELGKAQRECACPDIDTSSLLPADEEQGIVKLFPYNSRDQYLHVDPFKNVYSAKLVYVTTDGDYVTVKTFENVKPQYGRDGIGNYVEKCISCNLCECDCDDCLQLAVDAEWIDCLPDDLMYLWADMVTHEIDCNKNIKSESVTGHSWSKADTRSPEQLPHNILLLKRYAGPYGSVAVNPVL